VTTHETVVGSVATPETENVFVRVAISALLPQKTVAMDAS
jgi:hypothetical protein